MSVIVTVLASVAVEALPVRAPTKAVLVIEVPPVITPASTLIVPSKTMAEPEAGVRFKAPEFAVIVLPLIPRLSTVRAVKVPSDVMFPCAAVAKVPVIVPVTTMAPWKSTSSVPSSTLKMTASVLPPPPVVLANSNWVGEAVVE